MERTTNRNIFFRSRLDFDVITKSDRPQYNAMLVLTYLLPMTNAPVIRQRSTGDAILYI